MHTTVTRSPEGGVRTAVFGAEGGAGGGVGEGGEVDGYGITGRVGDGGGIGHVGGGDDLGFAGGEEGDGGEGYRKELKLLHSQGLLKGSPILLFRVGKGASGPVTLTDDEAGLGLHHKAAGRHI